MGLRDIGETLPPGFRFYPNDEELVCHYLYKKIANEEVMRGTLVEVDLHTCEPWQLPDVAKLNSDEWYFFSFRDRKYSTGFRTNRATMSGYWKATGKDRVVLDPRTRVVVGMRKTLVFYKNRAPNGIKTGWIMHEFRLENPHVPPKEDWVLCRVFNKSRGENNNCKFSPQSNNSYLDHIDGVTSPSLYAPCGYHNISSFMQGENPSTSLGLSPLEQPDYVLKPGNVTSSNNCHNKMIESATKCDHQDDYGFLFDFDGSNGVVPSGFEVEDLKFGDRDNNLIFM